MTFSGVALFLVLVLLGAAIAVPATWRRVPLGVRRGIRNAALASTVIVLGLTVPAALLPDTVDRVPSQERSAVRRALRHAPGCWFTSRVTRIRSTAASARDGFVYTCSWTILGWPSVSGEASCADGDWVLPGYLEPRYTFEPCGAAAADPA